ncbi:hypothetical protein FRB96_008552 [Tulasnella sp. 330]|nr:hypothetical protein FRB96_008552 [Tulasnella sp. 330]KAG8878782.1 hypothetical protein FRB98_005995 [Tulasnella sp. 332]
MSPCALRPGIGEPASSKVWTARAIDDTAEELQMHWPDDAGAPSLLKITTDKHPKASRKLWGRPMSYDLSADEQRVVLILDRDS